MPSSQQNSINLPGLIFLTSSSLTKWHLPLGILIQSNLVPPAARPRRILSMRCMSIWPTTLNWYYLLFYFSERSFFIFLFLAEAGTGVETGAFLIKGYSVSFGYQGYLCLLRYSHKGPENLACFYGSFCGGLAQYSMSIYYYCLFPPQFAPLLLLIIPSSCIISSLFCIKFPHMGSSSEDSSSMVIYCSTLEQYFCQVLGLLNISSAYLEFLIFFLERKEPVGRNSLMHLKFPLLEDLSLCISLSFLLMSQVFKYFYMLARPEMGSQVSYPWSRFFHLMRQCISQSITFSSRICQTSQTLSPPLRRI